MYKINSDLRYMGQFEARFFYPSYRKRKNVTNLLTWRSVWSLVKPAVVSVNGFRPLANVGSYSAIVCLKELLSFISFLRKLLSQHDLRTNAFKGMYVKHPFNHLFIHYVHKIIIYFVSNI